MTPRQALAGAVAAGVERLDAQLLLLQALGRAQSDRAWLLAHDDEEFGGQVERDYRQLLRRRAGGEPLAYLVGSKEFFGLRLLVDKRVLVPRPETETLVEWALQVLAGHFAPDPGSTASSIAGRAPNDKPSVLDLGTGSGAVALAVKHSRPDASVEAVDASTDALAVAAANAKALGLDIALRQASWLTGTAGRYDLIVSNPPYVAARDPHLAALAHEPRAALAAGPDGLDDIRAIASQAAIHLEPGGWLLLEHGWDQARAVRGLLAAAGLSRVGSRRDLAGIERCSGGQRLELG
ncbi:MAG: peptide chain release factor N(5)-glutamine methyltransferase [Pseudomonadota bacterium]|nr:peptide chain release factor N(5)-glutamine methyltransferase [Pseudomonadota bacterium]